MTAHPTDTSEELREAIAEEIWNGFAARMGGDYRSQPDDLLAKVHCREIADNALAAMSRARSTTGAVGVPDQTIRPQMGDEFNTPLTRTQFIVQMAIHIARCAGLDAKRALPIAASCYKEFMAEIAVTHGDPRYAWDEAAARTVVAEYELAPSASLPQPTAGSTGDDKPPVAPDGWCPRCEMKAKYHGGDEKHSCGALLVAAPDSCFPAGWLREEMERTSERVRQWREAASTPAQSVLLEALKAKKAQLQEYIAGIDPTTGEHRKHALTIAEGRLQQIDMDIALASQTPQSSGSAG